MSRRMYVISGLRGGKRLLPLFLYAQANGWTIARTNGGHLRFTKPGRPIIHTSSTPSDCHAVANAVAMLARADRFTVMEVPGRGRH